MSSSTPSNANADERASGTAQITCQLAEYPVATLFLDANFAIRSFTPAIEMLLPLTDADIGCPIDEFACPFDGPDLLTAARECLERHQVQEYAITARDGCVYRCHVAVSSTVRGKAAGIVFTFIDITALKRQAARCEHGWHSFRLLADALPGLVAYVDENLCFRFVNAAYHDWFDVDPQQLPGCHLSELLAGDHLAAIQPHCDASLTGEYVTYSDKLEHPRLGMRRLQVTHVPEAGPPSGFYMLAIDITELDQLEAARANRTGSMSELAATITHQIKQPLQAVSTYAAVLRRQFDDCEHSAELHDIAQKLADQSRLAGDILDELREFIGRRTFDHQEVHINQAIHRVLSLTEARLTTTKTHVRLDLAEPVAPVYGSPVQLDQVLVNLVINAAEAMSQCDRRQLAISTMQREQVLEVAVADSGPGIVPDQVDTVFNPFHTTKPDGMGMGLAISRGIIEDHGGQLWAEPGQEGGATFRIRLPIAGHGAGSDASGQAA